jgi:predicted dinucleotide-binding enzyme
MKIAVLGTGDVGKVLADGLLSLGHEVAMGSRERGNPKAQAWAKSAGGKGTAGTFEEVTRNSEMIVLATLGTGTEEAIRLAGVPNFRGKVVLDATNPLDFTKDGKPFLFVGPQDSLGERIQKLVPDAKVVKAFNSVGKAVMVRPRISDGKPDMFICGNDGSAKNVVAQICEAWNWGVVDIGDIEGARYLEPMSMVWVAYMLKKNHFTHAFKLVGKAT